MYHLFLIATYQKRKERVILEQAFTPGLCVAKYSTPIS